MSYHIAGIGEVLWDVYPTSKNFGGAVANVAFHAQQLGAHAYIISAVGDDDLGEEGAAYLKEHGLDMSALTRVEGLPTGTVNVTLDENKVPTYDIVEGVAWENLPWMYRFGEIAKELDAVCFGSLAQRGELTKETVHQFLDSLKPECLKVYDVNLRINGYSDDIIKMSMGKANVLKLSDEELKIVAEIVGIDSSLADEKIIEKLIEMFDFTTVLYTLGKDGAILFTPKNSYSFSPEPIKPVSTVGAGDSFTARAIFGLLNNEDPAVTVQKACELAAYVCKQEGAMPKLPENFKSGLV